MSIDVPDALYDIRTKLEQAIATFLNDVVATFTRENAAAQFQKPRARFEIVIKLGAPVGRHRRIIGRQLRYDMYNFACSITIITEPNGDPTQNSYHEQMVSHADNYMNGVAFASQDDLTTFPEVTILFIEPGARMPELTPQAGTEKTVLNYNGHCGIRPSAWPA